MHQIDYFPVLSSLVAGELARRRKCSGLETETAEISAATEIGNGDLGTDSLDLLHLAAAVNEMFHLHETGVEEYLLRHRRLGEWAEIITVSLRKQAERITFRTSGSSGKPKACRHSVTDLQQEVELHASRYCKCRRVLTFVPRHHIYGFIWAVMLPQALGAEVLDVRRWAPAKLFSQLKPGDLLIGTPATWRHLSEWCEVFPTSIKGVTSSSLCPAGLFRELLSHGLELTEVYGSSETGGIGSRSASDEPFELLPFWSPEASATLLLRVSQNGETRPFEIPDNLNWVSERQFVVAERRDGAVQVSGSNVFPERIAELIRSHIDVKDCAVRLMMPQEGNRLKAFVVLHEGARIGRMNEKLEAWLRTLLQPHERPTNFVFGPDLPRNEMGKLADWSCA